MNAPGNPTMMFNNNDVSPDNSFAINSKIMIVAVVVLFGVVMFILGLHIYAKWFWRHGAQNGSSGGWRRRRRLEFAADWPGHQRTTQVGLEKSVLDQLPTFTYSEEKEKAATLKEGGGLECAVCLEEFAEGEKGRLLPKCNHSFHIDCIDMWFHSHSTCPLCRCSVGPETTSPANPTTIPPLRAFSAHSGTPFSGMHREGLSPSGDGVVYIDAGAGVSAFSGARDYNPDNHHEGLQPAGSAATVVASVEHGTELYQPQPDGARAGVPPPRPSSVVAHQHQQQGSRPESPSSRRSSTALSPKPAGIQYPANVLFWGNQTQMNIYSGPAGIGVAVPAPREENSARRSSGVHAPNSLMIEIPRALPVDSSAGAAYYTSSDEPHRASDSQGGPKSPIGRLVTTSFRRLLSIRRGATSPGPEGTCSSYDLEQGSTISSSAGAVHQRQSQS